jgi:uncharacterized membrane protein (DUF2068 family)
MNITQQIRHRIIAVLAIVPGLLSIKEGGSVLLGISTPAYHVLHWLVVYNIVMGLFSLIAGTGIWMQRIWGSILAALILLCHGLVFLTVFFLFLFREPVAPVSVLAMLIRTAVWFIIYLLLRWAVNAKAYDA